MKYTSRKKTPLKWLNFLKFFILPVQILFYIFVFVSILMELFGTDMLPHLLAPILNIYGYSANHLGSAFWPILSVLLALIILVYWVFEIERGLIKFSTVLWNLYLVIMYVICGGVMVMALMYLPPSTVSTVVLGYLVNFGVKVPASFVSYIPLLVFVVVWLIAGIIYICLNIIYFVRRKALFAKDYTEEVEKETSTSTVEEVKTEETIPSETGEKSEAEATPVDMVEETQGAESSGEKVEETTEEEPVETEPVLEEAPKVDPVETEGYTQVISTAIENDTAEVKEPAHKVCKECGAEVLEEDAIFCTNCGKKLDV